MQIAGVEETNTVTDETPIIETANASVGTTLDDTAIEVPPQPGRDAFYLGITIPGVVTTADPQWQGQQDLPSTSLLSLGGGSDGFSSDGTLNPIGYGIEG